MPNLTHLNYLLGRWLLVIAALWQISCGQPAATTATADPATALASAVANPARSEADRGRDRYRHPAQTLEFFGLQPEMTVVEIWPGGGWYSDILAAFNRGQLIAAHFPERAAAGSSERVSAYFDRSRSAYTAKLAAPDSPWQNIELAQFDPAQDLLTVAANSADALLTFRNVHNWLNSDSEQRAFELFFTALRPGGVLGVVEHRSAPGTDRETMRSSGYMTEAYVIELAAAAGFVLEASSEINANPLDTRNHPAGVWTLPPSLRLGEERRAEYLAIGESDRMTLRFRKPHAQTDSGGY